MSSLSKIRNRFGRTRTGIGPPGVIDQPMMIDRIRGRVIAGATHLGISGVVAIAAVILIFGIWYPGPLASAQGVDQLVLVVIAVDLVIGPLITAIIYVKGKRGLTFDLTIIAILQVLALTYGLKSIYDGRPAYVVFNVDRFDVVASAEINRESLKRVRDAALRPSYFHPKWVAAELPDDPKKRNELLFSALGGGADLPQLPEYFVPLENQREAMLQRLHPLDELRKLNEVDDSEWHRILARLRRSEPEVGYLPMRANSQDGAVVVDARAGTVLEVKMLAPNFAAASKPAAPTDHPLP